MVCPKEVDWSQLASQLPVEHSELLPERCRSMIEALIIFWSTPFEQKGTIGFIKNLDGTVCVTKTLKALDFYVKSA